MPYTKYEIARLIGARAFQLALNSPPGVEPTEEERFHMLGVLLLAERELAEGKIPLKVKKKRKGEKD